MAELSTLARPYAKAAFEYADQAGELSSWSEQLALAAAVSAKVKVGKVLGNPALTSKQQAQIFLDVCGDALAIKVKNFVRVLAENKRLALLPQISLLFDLFKSNREKSVDVEVATAFELDATLLDTLAKALGKKLERDVKLSTVIDKNLLGGVVVRAADTVIDGSVRGRLNKLAEALNA